MHRAGAVLRFLEARPVAIFSLLSAVFGGIIVGVAPPLRGPDETAHFLRAYGISIGDLLPTIQDSQSRKGVLLPGSLHRDFAVFDRWQNANRGHQFSYRQVFEEVRSTGKIKETPTEDEVFVPYAGSEGYSPIAYLPQAAAASVARLFGLGFLETFYLMRIAGLAIMTAVVAYAIAITPALKWALVAIAMLPAALYGRAVINADAAALSFSLVIFAIFLRILLGAPAPSVIVRASWMLVCVLSKPPNAAFVLLEWFSHGSGRLRRTWLSATLVTLPALIAAMLWTMLSSADVAAWRLVELTGVAAKEFDPKWKVHFMLANPLAFPSALAGFLTKQDFFELGRQVIGVLGLFDTVLRPWLYNVLGILLVCSFIGPLSTHQRFTALLAAVVTTIVYCFAIVLIFYLIWTPINADQIWGVQGRYFLPVLPLVALAIALAFTRGLDGRVRAWLAIAVAILSGLGSIDAILRTDWNF